MVRVPPTWHRVARVEREVHDDLFEFAAITADGTETRRQGHVYVDSLANEALEQRLESIEWVLRLRFRG